MPTTQGLVAGGATASAVATGIFDASTVVLLSYVDVFPLLLFVAEEFADPPEPPWALLLFVLEEFPELVNVEFPLFFTADAPPVAVEEPPAAVLFEFPPVALEVLFEFELELEVAPELLEEFTVIGDPFVFVGVGAGVGTLHS
jgi:hypothetical protein